MLKNLENSKKTVVTVDGTEDFPAALNEIGVYKENGNVADYIVYLYSGDYANLLDEKLGKYADLCELSEIAARLRLHGDKFAAIFQARPKDALEIFGNDTYFYIDLTDYQMSNMDEALGHYIVDNDLFKMSKKEIEKLGLGMYLNYETIGRDYQPFNPHNVIFIKTDFGYIGMRVEN